MKRTPTLAVAVAIIAASPCSARPSSSAGSAGGTRHLLQTYYHQMDAGYAEHDLTKAFTYYSDDFTMEDAAGDQTDLGSFKGNVSDLFTRARLVQSTSRITGMTYQAHGCELTVQEHLLFTGISLKTGQLARIEGFTQVRDTWTKAPGGWRLLKTKIVRARGLWDGHKFTEDDLPDSSGAPQDSGPVPGGDGGG